MVKVKFFSVPKLIPDQIAPFNAFAYIAIDIHLQYQYKAKYRQYRKKNI